MPKTKRARTPLPNLPRAMTRTDFRTPEERMADARRAAADVPVAMRALAEAIRDRSSSRESGKLWPIRIGSWWPTWQAAVHAVDAAWRPLHCSDAGWLPPFERQAALDVSPALADLICESHTLVWMSSGQSCESGSVHPHGCSVPRDRPEELQRLADVLARALGIACGPMPTIPRGARGLDATEAAILQYLGGSMVRQKVIDLAAAIVRSEDVVSQRLRSLRERGIVDWPPNSRNGASLTEEGKRLAATLRVEA